MVESIQRDWKQPAFNKTETSDVTRRVTIF